MSEAKMKNLKKLECHQNTLGGKMIKEAKQAKEKGETFKCLVILRGLGLKLNLNLMKYVNKIEFYENDIKYPLIGVRLINS